MNPEQRTEGLLQHCILVRQILSRLGETQKATIIPQSEEHKVLEETIVALEIQLRINRRRLTPQLKSRKRKIKTRSRWVRAHRDRKRDRIRKLIAQYFEVYHNEEEKQ